MSQFEEMPPLNLSDGKDKKISRRNFLKGAGAGLVIGATGIGVAELLKSNYKDESDIDFEDDTIEEEYQVTPEQAGIEDENIKSVAEILSYDNKEEIDLDEKVADKTKNYWKKIYGDDGKMHQDLITAYSEMQEWTPQLENIFKEEDVPVKFIYLAIPESHWRLESKSRVGARGPYQLMPKTAETFGCKNNEEMEDPLKSARACAKYLKYLYDNFGDWDLALSGYNGGFIWHYKKQEKEKLSYHNFLKYIESKIKEKRKKVSNLSISYKVKKGDTIWKLARQYEVEDSDILFNSRKAGNDIRVGQQLTILIKNEQTRRGIFKKSVRGFAENLNYPAKFNAVIELIEEMDNEKIQLAQVEKM